MDELYDTDLDRWINDLPNQLKIIFPEALVRELYAKLDREKADMVIIDLVRYFVFGDEPKSVGNGYESIAFSLLTEKVGCFGIALNSKDGEKDG